MPTLVPVQGDPFAPGYKPSATLPPGYKIVQPAQDPALATLPPGYHLVPVQGNPFAPAPPPRHVGTGEDMARSGLAGTVQGVEGIYSTPGDLQNMATHALFGLLEKSHVLTPVQRARAEETAAQMRSLMPSIFGPSQQTTAENIKALPAPVNKTATYQPKTVQGEYARTVGQFLPNALTPGGLGVKTAAVLAPALTSETAGQAARKFAPKHERLARLLGAVAGGAALAAPGFGAGPRDQRMIAQAAENLTPEDVAQAAALMERSNALPGGGLPVAGDEALNITAPGRAEGLRRLVGSVANTKAGGARIGATLAERPGQVTNAAEGVLDQIAPAAADPVELGLAGQKAADSALRQIQRARAAETAPLYGAVNTAEVNPTELSALLTDMQVTAAQDKTGLLRPALQEVAGRIMPEGSNGPVLDVGNLDRIRKYYRDVIDLPPGSQGALKSETAGVLGGYLDKLDSILENVPGFAAAKAKHAAISDATVNPALAGPLGAMRKTPDVVSQTSRLFPNQPSPGQAAVTERALANLGDPQLGAQLMRQHLARALAEQTQTPKSGIPSPTGGAAFAATVAGNPEQRAVLNAAVRAVAPEAADNVDTLVQALQATGSRRTLGAAGGAYEQDLRDLGSGEAFTEGAKALAQPHQIPRRIDTWLERGALERNANKVLNVMEADPKEFARLLNAAMKRGPKAYSSNMQRQAVANALLGANSGARNRPPSE